MALRMGEVAKGEAVIQAVEGIPPLLRPLPTSSRPLAPHPLTILPLACRPSIPLPLSPALYYPPLHIPGGPRGLPDLELPLAILSPVELQLTESAGLLLIAISHQIILLWIRNSDCGRFVGIFLLIIQYQITILS